MKITVLTKNLLCFFCFSAGGLLCLSAAAGGPEANPQIQPPQNIFFCPPIKALQKNETTRKWWAPGGWQSHDMSFVDKVSQFAGAQWRGTNVGQIFCVYRGESETDFPVLLAFKTLAYAPKSGKWTGNLGGYQNCESPNQEDCPFSIRLKPEETDIYEQAGKLKQTAPRPHTPGF